MEPGTRFTLKTQLEHRPPRQLKPPLEFTQQGALAHAASPAQGDHAGLFQ